MPNIELHGYAPEAAAATKEKVRKALASSEEADEMVTTTYPTVVEDLKGKQTPFLRVIGSLRELPDLLERLKPLREDMEVIVLGQWMPKQDVADTTASQDELESLRISPQCRTKYPGEWLKPVRLTQDEINEILDRLPKDAAREMHELLVTHGNRVGCNITSTSGTRTINRELAKPVRGKYYRLARGTNRAGRYHSQLWEVRPSTK